MSLTEILPGNEYWMLTNEKLKNTNSAKVMHCLPVRRDLGTIGRDFGWRKLNRGS